MQAPRGQQLERATLHGALLDAGLLAEVYIRMTRGQNSLVIDAADVFAADAGGRGRSTFGVLELIVVEADEAECAAHEAVLAEIDKASGGHAVWRPAPLFAPEAMAQ